jgi:hypothetical protein
LWWRRKLRDWTVMAHQGVAAATVPVTFSTFYASGLASAAKELRYSSPWQGFSRFDRSALSSTRAYALRHKPFLLWPKRNRPTVRETVSEQQVMRQGLRCALSRISRAPRAQRTFSATPSERDTFALICKDALTHEKRPRSRIR